MSSPPTNRRRTPHTARPADKLPHAVGGAASKPKGAALKEREAARRALAASAKLRASRRRRLLTVLAPVGAVVIVLALFLAVNAATSSNHSGKKSSTAAAAVLAQVTGVPLAAFDAAGAGAGTQNTALAAISSAGLTADGKPRVLYVGAEYCPFCAAERWAVVVALSRFGSWSGLKYSYSGAAPEVFPNTPTFTFHGASYTSRWISFTGVETQSNQQVGGSWGPLDTLSPADAAIMHRYDAQGSIPFTDLAGHYVVNGATYDPGVLAGKTHAQIAATLSRPGTARSGTAIDGAANVITAALCRATGGRPSATCSTAGVTAAANALPK